MNQATSTISPNMITQLTFKKIDIRNDHLKYMLLTNNMMIN